MPLYAPLTPEQCETLNLAIDDIVEQVNELDLFDLGPVLEPGDEDQLSLAVGEFRVHVQKLDLALFQMFGLIAKLKQANTPSDPNPAPVPRRPPPTLDSLEDMFT